MPARDVILVSRQPVCGPDRRVHGYELRLAAPGARPAASPEAGARLLVEALDPGRLDGVTRGAPAHVAVAPALLPLLEGLPVEPHRAVLRLPAAAVDAASAAAARRLRRDGWTLALAGLPPGTRDHPLLGAVQQVVVDALWHGAEGAARQARALAGRVTVVATNVGDAETFGTCVEAGAELLQGDFLLEPRLSAGEDRAQAAWRTVARLHDPGLGPEGVEAVVREDLALGLRLLRHVNSAWFGLRREVTTVREAVVLLGPRRVRRWASVLAVAGATGASAEVLAIALRRGRLCEALAAGRGLDPEAAFTTGLFSAADALLGVPLHDALAGLPLAAGVRDALLDHHGPLGELLREVLAHEDGHFDALADAEALAVQERYRDALG